MKNKISKSSFNRRNFMKILSAIGASGFIKTRGVFSLIVPAEKSRLVIIEDKNVINNTTINKEVVQEMVNDGICALSIIDDIGEAWKSFFTNISSKSVIAIKVNCRFSSLNHAGMVQNKDPIVAGILKENKFSSFSSTWMKEAPNQSPAYNFGKFVNEMMLDHFDLD